MDLWSKRRDTNYANHLTYCKSVIIRDLSTFCLNWRKTWREFKTSRNKVVHYIWYTCTGKFFVQLTFLVAMTISMAFRISGAKLVGLESFIVGVTSLYVCSTSRKPTHEPYSINRIVSVENSYMYFFPETVFIYSSPFFFKLRFNPGLIGRSEMSRDVGLPRTTNFKVTLQYLYQCNCQNVKSTRETCFLLQNNLHIALLSSTLFLT